MSIGEPTANDGLSWSGIKKKKTQGGPDSLSTVFCRSERVHAIGSSGRVVKVSTPASQVDIMQSWRLCKRRQHLRQHANSCCSHFFNAKSPFLATSRFSQRLSNTEHAPTKTLGESLHALHGPRHPGRRKYDKRNSTITRQSPASNTQHPNRVS